jgi:ATP-binding cassette subfamily F protein uup
MDRLVNHLFVFEGDGVINDFPGNYSRYRESIDTSSKPGKELNEGKISFVDRLAPSSDKKRQLSFKEKREFETLEKEITELTKEKESVTHRLNSGDASFDELQELSNRIGEVGKLLDEKELRWLELSEFVQ